MFNCPKCNREFQTPGRMNNHINKCRGKCPQCNEPIIKGIKFCSRKCYKEFLKQNPEYCHEITKQANQKSKELGSLGLHWSQRDDEKTKAHHKKWYEAAHEKTRELVEKGEFWSQADKDKVQEAMTKIHTKEAHEKLSQTLTGREFSQNHRRNISRVRKEKGLAKGKNNPMFGKSPKTTKGFKSGIRSDLGHFVRSTWEANFARILKYKGLEYQFEPFAFEIYDGEKQLTYRPDFKVSDKYYEIKGFWYDDSKQKFELFKQQYPEIKIEVIDSIKYRQLEQKYRLLIEEWE